MPVRTAEPARKRSGRVGVTMLALLLPVLLLVACLAMDRVEAPLRREAVQERRRQNS